MSEKKSAQGAKRRPYDSQVGSMTNALADIAYGEEMSPKLFQFMQQRLKGFVTKILKSIPESEIDVDDVLQEVARKGWETARRQSFASREDFLRLLICMVRAKVADHSRRAFAIKRGSGLKRASAEKLEHMADNRNLSRDEKEAVDEILSTVRKILTAISDPTKKIVCGYWVVTFASTKQIHERLKLDGSERSVARWIASFRHAVSTAWEEKLNLEMETSKQKTKKRK